jgi:hypothetical protein
MGRPVSPLNAPVIHEYTDGTIALVALAVACGHPDPLDAVDSAINVYGLTAARFIPRTILVQIIEEWST